MTCLVAAPPTSVLKSRRSLQRHLPPRVVGHRPGASGRSALPTRARPRAWRHVARAQVQALYPRLLRRRPGRFPRRFVISGGADKPDSIRNNTGGARLPSPFGGARAGFLPRPPKDAGPGAPLAASLAVSGEARGQVSVVEKQHRPIGRVTKPSPVTS